MSSTHVGEFADECERRIFAVTEQRNAASS